MRDRQITFGAVSTLALVLGVGCAIPKRGSSDTVQNDARPNEASFAGTNGSPSVFNRPLQRLVVEFKVHRISGPKGSFTENDELWKLVNGPLSDAAVSLRILANGFRAAVGRESDREALLEYLKQIKDPRTAVDHVQPDASKLVELDLGPCPEHLTVFYFDDAGSMHGMDFLNAKSRLKMAYELRYANLDEVWVEVAPEIEQPPGPPKWIKPPNGLPIEVPEERRHTFEELKVAARVTSGGFLLIGPTAEVYDRPLVARPMFIEELPAPADLRPGEANGAPVERESIYVISPIVRSYSEKNAPRNAAPPAP